MQSSSEQPLVGEERYVTTRITAAKETTQNRTITTITGVIFNYLEILEYRLKTLIENPKETAVVMNVIWNRENKSKGPEMN